MGKKLGVEQLGEAGYLGDAIFIGDFEPNSPEWHELRDTGIGGSDVAAIVGVSKYQSAYALWAKKCKLIPDDFTDNQAMEWGRRLESVIFEKFEDSHPELEVYTAGTFRNVARDFQIVNPDGVIKYPDGSYGILEIKTARYEDDWVNGVPRYYQTQVQWYMQAFGFKKSVVAVLFGGSKYIEYEVPANEFEQDINLEQVERFITYVKTQTKPDWDGSTATYETIRAMNPDIDDSEVDLGDIAIHLVNAQTDYKAAEERLNMMKSIALDNMGKSRHGLHILDSGEVIRICSRTSRGSGLPYLVMKK